MSVLPNKLRERQDLRSAIIRPANYIESSKRFIPLLLFICFYAPSFGQNKVQKLKIFIDCNETPCDYNFIRTEITLIDFVLDRIAADAHILITSVKNGNGARRIQYIFFGQHRFANYSDTLISTLSPNATDIEIRQEVANRIKMGLVSFYAHSDLANQINIVLTLNKGYSEQKLTNQSSLQIMMRSPSAKAIDTRTTQNTRDKWNYWVFNVGSDGVFNLDQVYKSIRTSGNVSANRITNKLKVNFNAFGGQDNSSYSYELNGVQSKYIVTNSNYGLNHKLIKSISKHWSAGYETYFNNNTFLNIKSQFYLRPAVEYAIFPYSQVNNKFFTIGYGLDVRRNSYYETTIYDKNAEILWGHKLQSYLSIKQKWGNINSSIAYSNFFNNWKFNNLTVSLTVNVRITGGLFFYTYANAGLTRDQLYLVKGTASEQDVLVRRRQLASAYNFYSGVGLSYRFGSILNNFVNPRFDQP